MQLGFLPFFMSVLGMGENGFIRFVEICLTVGLEIISLFFLGIGSMRKSHTL